MPAGPLIQDSLAAGVRLRQGFDTNLALLFPVPKKCRRPYLGCNSCLGGQFRANLVLEIAYSAEFSLYFSLFLGESSSLVTASSASQSASFSLRGGLR